jgi:hypothetical protein
MPGGMRGVGLVSEETAERCGGRECGLLQEGGRAWELDGVEVGVGDDGEPEWVGEALAVGLAFGCEGEHRFDQRLELEPDRSYA